MANTVGLKLQLDGESEYKQSLSNIVAQTKTLDAEMKTLQSSFESGAQSVEDHQKVLDKAKEKSGTLEKQVELLKSKVEESAKATGENSTQTEQWKKKLADAETQLNKTNKQIEEEQNAIDDLQSPLGELTDLIEQQKDQLEELREEYANAWLSGDTDRCDELAGSIQNLSGELDANQAHLDEATGAADELAGGLGGATDASSALGAVMPASFNTIAGAAMTADIGGIIKGITSAISDTIEKVDEMVMEWEGASDTIAISTGATGDALEELENNMIAAYEGSRALGQSLEEAGAITGQVQTRFRVEGEELTQLTELFEEFSYAAGVDGVTAVTDVSRITKAWSEENVTAADVIDRLVWATEQSGESLGDVMKMMDDCHGYLNDLGMSFDEGIDFMVQYSLAGGDVNGMLRALKEASDNVTDSGYDASIMFNKAIDLAGEYTSSADAMNAVIGDTGMTIADVFGNSKSSRAMVDVFANGKMEIEGLKSAAEDAPGAFSRLMEEITSAYDLDKKAMETQGAQFKRHVSESVDAQVALRRQMAAALTGNQEDFAKWSAYIEQNFQKVKSSGSIVRDFFANMRIQFPSIKLPHFSIAGSFSLNPPSVPHLRVDWYRKAYDQAYLLNNPTIFGANSRGLLGGGDGNGTEVVVGESHLMSMFTREDQYYKGYAPSTVGGSTTNNYGGANVNVNVYGAPGQDVRELARLVSNEIDRSVRIRTV